MHTQRQQSACALRMACGSCYFTLHNLCLCVCVCVCAWIYKEKTQFLQWVNIFSRFLRFLQRFLIVMHALHIFNYALLIFTQYTKYRQQHCVPLPPLRLWLTKRRYCAKPMRHATCCIHQLCMYVRVCVCLYFGCSLLVACNCGGCTRNLLLH